MNEFQLFQQNIYKVYYKFKNYIKITIYTVRFYKKHGFDPFVF
jgi:hypothetical protein